MNQRYNDDDFAGFVEELVITKRLNKTEAGIAKQMLDQGYNSLSEIQKNVFDNAIERNSVKECKRCSNEIPWSEMIEALDNGGLCGWCHHFKSKMEEE
ncbi:MAG: hypothetical protein E7077_05755 [Bacteroidales bacterium]|jgi:hypothetical protein|nr:hypothetical protein [Bacteroidales bacterium]MEE1084164.1 hypothetical protein [Paludibacteraceae bacterium]